MKKLLMLFCLILSYCTMVNAHAGMYDRYLDMKICVDALVMVIAVIQVSIYLFLRYSKSKVSCWYKRLIIRIAKKVYKKSYLKWFASWALSSLVFAPYVIGLSMEFFFFAFIPLAVFDILQLLGLEHGKAQKAPNRNKRFIIALICLISTSIRLFDICSYLRNLYIS